MNRPVKIILYIVFIAMAVGFGLAAKGQLHRAAATQVERQRKLDQVASVDNPRAAVENTNLVAEVTNAVGDATNAASQTSNSAARLAPPPAGAEVAGNASISYSKMVGYGLLCVAGFVGFAFLLARDISTFFATKAEQALFNDEGAPADPEYEQSEELWKDGKYLEAIQAMRDYLKKNPREQYVALRIAEIYEENLANPLAAALEYEEVLKKNLPAERWGWGAIHLANIYSGKLNQPDKAVALLRRIDCEYGTTSAANKARERLMQIDPNFVPAAVAAAPIQADAEEARAASNLPPGFRPKS